MITFYSNLPIIVINTFGASIPDDPKVTANMRVVGTGPGFHSINDSSSFDGRIGIELRGQSSQSFPKKQYGIETRDEADEDLKVSILGMPEESDWVLQAPYSDKTLMRNFLTYKLSNDLNRYASRTQFVEVFLNDTGEAEVSDEHYVGVYVFMEKIKRGPNRVAITKSDPNAESEPEITGGYILKFDKGNDDQFQTDPPWLHDVKITYPKDVSTNDFNHYIWISDYVKEFETALKSTTFEDPDTGYAKYIDVNSFVDFLLLNEALRNIDGLRISTYFHKDREGKIHMGPVWDFNLSMGNVDYQDGEKTDGWLLGSVQDNNWPQPQWWKRLLEDYNFSSKMVRRWRELREEVLNTNRVHTLIDVTASLLHLAQQRNFTRWPILGERVWPNPEPVPATYEEEIQHLKNWLEARWLWIDNNIENLMNTCKTTGKVIMLRAHEHGSGYGPSEDQIDVEIVFQLDSTPAKSYGFKLRQGEEEDRQRVMFDLLRDSFNNDRPVCVIHSITTGNNSEAIWVSTQDRKSVFPVKISID